MANFKTKKKRKDDLWSRQRGTCHYCGINMKKHGNEDNSATIEHLMPKAVGGPNSRWNLVLACRKCNQNKGSAWLEKLVDSGDLKSPARNGVVVQVHGHGAFPCG